MRRVALIGALTVAVALCAILVARDCTSCRRGLSLPLAGLCCYGALLVVALRWSDRLSFRCAVVAVGGIHAGLVGLMVSRGTLCPFCVGVAACAGIALISSLRSGDWRLVPAIAPWTAAAIVAVVPSGPPHHPASRDPLTLTIYSSPECPYCDRLRDDVLPRARAGIDVRVEYRDAASAEFVQRTPTIVITRGRAMRVLEGLPAPETLRRELQSIGGGS